MKKILALFIGNSVFANVVLVAILVCGSISGINMIRETFPEFSLDMITISVAYPGADPKEVEEEVSCKIEEAIENIEGIEKYNTFSKENICLSNVEIKSNYKVDKIIDDLKTAINSISDFPNETEKPIIKELILKDPVSLLYISGKTSIQSIQNLSLKIKEEIERLPEVSQVEIFGDKKNEINIEISEKTLRKFNTSLLELGQIIKKNNLNLAAGKIRNQDEEISIRTIGKKYKGEDLASILTFSNENGGFIHLDKIADIRDYFDEDNIEVKVNGSSGIILTVYKTSREDSLAISNAIRKYINKKKLSIPKNIELGLLYDNTDMLRSRINLLLKNGLLGLIFVFFSLWLFVDFKLSFWAGMSIVVSISGALTIIYLMNETINMISLFGLIMVLGIVVDDAIIIGEAIQFKKSKGEIGLQAAMNGLFEVGIPVFTAVTTTIIAFIPLFFIGGIMGKFISILPIVVIACLSVSLIESLFLLPTHLSFLDKKKIKNNKNEITILKKINKLKKIILKKMNWFIFKIYSPLLSKLLNWRYLVLSSVAVILLIFLSLLKNQYIKFEVFPSIDGFVMTSTIEYPHGTPLDITKKNINKIEKALTSLGNKIETKSGKYLIKSYISVTGETLEEMPKKGSHLGSVQAILIDSEKRGIHCDSLMALWEEEIGKICGINLLKFEGLSAGPPGLPIEIWIKGNDPKILSEASSELIMELKKFNGVYQISSDLSSKKKEICLKLKPQGRLLGLNIADLALQLKAAYYGIEILKIHKKGNDTKIKVRYPLKERNDLSDLEKMRIRTKEGNYIPLESIAEISFNSTFSTIKRTNGMRRVSVSAKIDSEKITANQVLLDLSKKKFPKLIEKYPEIIISPQGEQKKMTDSLKSLIIGFPIAVLSIFMIISITFKSYIQPFIVISTIPLGIVGAIIGHLLLRYNMTIMSIFGMVALTGIVVNDAIVFIEQVNKNLAQKNPFFKSIIEGGIRRFMAIFLTTISTVIGLMPIVLENDLQAKFLIPMAISIAFGTAFASVVTLIWIPSALTILSDFRLIIHKTRTGYWEKREILEPSYNKKS